MANISEFKAQLTGGGARANQFRVELSFPTYVTGGIPAALKGQFLCRSAQLPSSNITDIPLQYRGREVHIAGERIFEPWTVSIYNDTDFIIRNAMEVWSNGIQNNEGTDGRVNPSDYQVTMSVYQLDRAGNPIKRYTFVDAYPLNISAIGLDFDAANAIETFDVTFQYNYWTSDTTGTAGGFGVTGSISTPIGSIPL